MTTCGRESHKDLKIIINHPLQPSERADHHNSDRQAVPQAAEADLAINPLRCDPCALARHLIGVQFGNHDVGWMRDDSAENTRQITTGERDGGLGSLAVVSFLAREVRVDHLDDGLEGGKFHHGVSVFMLSIRF